MAAENLSSLSNKRILLGVTGGIAAYKSAELLRRLQDQGADVRVVMTQAATSFITPLTMQALSGHPVHTELLDTETESAMGHIEFARWADLVLIAPASANFLARLAAGKADDLLTTLCLAAQCDLAVAPAMNQAMWSDQATQDNIQTLQDRGVHMFGPEAGLQACGEEGLGRLLAVDELVSLAAGVFLSGALAGHHVVITAGPTREAIDPVRYISNHSSGKQGFSLAEAAIEAGARVTLIAGPTPLATPDKVERINVISARDMLDAALNLAEDCDIFIAVAAVADYRPEDPREHKIKKSDQGGTDTFTIHLVENPDIVATISAHPNRPFTVGFAAETRNVVDYARKKLMSKGLDMIIANDVADNRIGFNSDHNETTVLWPEGEEHFHHASKAEISRQLIQLIASRINAHAVPAAEQA